jgi:XamI restriction endonuclease
MRRVETLRRNEGRGIQERLVETQLLRARLKQVRTRRVRTLSDAPKAGEFCRESHLGKRKADFIIGLWDGRTMALECKVSNSSTNSVKRLNNDAAVKAEVWRDDFGKTQVVPAAVLSGVYALRNLEDAQGRGLSLFWAHDLKMLTDWLYETKPGGDSGLSTG